MRIQDRVPKVEEEEVREEMVPGVARALSPLVRRILATNPGVRTGEGTNTYLVGIDEIVVIDPGPDDAEHRRSITGCGGDRIRWIMLTSPSPEHAGSAEALREETGAEILASPKFEDIEIDQKLKDGFILVGTEFRLKVHYTPGMSPESICLELPEERLLFAGDLVVEGSPNAITHPKGSMVDYMDSIARMQKLRLKRVAPGHGYVLEEPKTELADYVAHRIAREVSILAAVGSLDKATSESITELVYEDPRGVRLELAAAMVDSHLGKLKSEGSVKKSRAGVWTVA